MARAQGVTCEEKQALAAPIEQRTVYRRSACEAWSRGTWVRRVLSPGRDGLEADVIYLLNRQMGKYELYRGMRKRDCDA